MKKHYFKISFFIITILFISYGRKKEITIRDGDFNILGIWAKTDTTFREDLADTIININSFIFREKSFINGCFKFYLPKEKIEIDKFETGHWYTKDDSLFFDYSRIEKLNEQMNDNPMVNEARKKMGIENFKVPVPENKVFSYSFKDSVLYLFGGEDSLKFRKPIEPLFIAIDSILTNN